MTTLSITATGAVTLAGDWTILAVKKHWPKLAPLFQQLRYQNCPWDLQRIGKLDRSTASFLWEQWEGQIPEGSTIATEYLHLFDALRSLEPIRHKKSPTPFLQLLRYIGNATIEVGVQSVAIIHLFGEVVLELLQTLRKPSRFAWRECSAHIFRTGIQALGITALVGFMIGIVLSYLTGRQLELYGAKVYLVNLLGMSIIRELGPVLAAILIAGRSGSAMTAQLGVMRVTQEMDALTVLGISHLQRLVVPRVVALACVLPLLILWTDAISLLGGAFAAQWSISLKASYFMQQLPSAVPYANMWIGLGKGVIFGILIALIACHYGLRIAPNTVSLGKGTTASVVTSITTVIIVDAIFAVMLSDVGLH